MIRHRYLGAFPAFLELAGAEIDRAGVVRPVIRNGAAGASAMIQEKRPSFDLARDWLRASVRA